MAADLLRAGAGLNAMVSPAFYQLSPEGEALAESLRDRDARVFTCSLLESPAYNAARQLRVTRHELWTFAVQAETFSPFANMSAQIATAYNIDRTMLVPTERVLSPDEAGCVGAPHDVDALRLAGVTHVLSLDPLTHGSLTLEQTIRPQRIAPLVVFVYALQDPLPRREVARDVRRENTRGEAEARARDAMPREPGVLFVEGAALESEGARGQVLAATARAGRLDLRVSADRATAVIVREGYAAGWTAEVNGLAAPVWRANGRHLAVPIPTGESRVTLRYAPPHLHAAFFVAGAAALLLIALWRTAPRPS
jgi:hypothetical protein